MWWSGGTARAPPAIARASAPTAATRAADLDTPASLLRQATLADGTVEPRAERASYGECVSGRASGPTRSSTTAQFSVEPIPATARLAVSEPRGCSAAGSDRAAVGDDEERLARVRGGDLEHRGDHDALAHLLVALAAAPSPCRPPASGGSRRDRWTRSRHGRARTSCRRRPRATRGRSGPRARARRRRSPPSRAHAAGRSSRSRRSGGPTARRRGRAPARGRARSAAGRRVPASGARWFQSVSPCRARRSVVTQLT